MKNLRMISVLTCLVVCAILPMVQAAESLPVADANQLIAEATPTVSNVLHMSLDGRRVFVVDPSNLMVNSDVTLLKVVSADNPVAFRALVMNTLTAFKAANPNAFNSNGTPQSPMVIANVETALNTQVGALLAQYRETQAQMTPAEVRLVNTTSISELRFASRATFFTSPTGLATEAATASSDPTGPGRHLVSCGMCGGGTHPIDSCAPLCVVDCLWDPYNCDVIQVSPPAGTGVPPCGGSRRGYGRLQACTE